MLLKFQFVHWMSIKFDITHDKSKHVGQGKGDSKVGDVVAKDGKQGKGAKGQGKQAGDEPGHDYYEAEVSLDEIEDALFKELELPN